MIQGSSIEKIFRAQQVLLQLAADCFVVTEASSGEAGDTGISRFARSLFSGLTAEQAKEKAVEL